MTRPLKAIAISLCVGALLTFAGDGDAAELTRPKLVRGSGATDRALTTAGPDGAEYRLPGGGVVRVAPGTVFKVYGASQDLLLRPGPKVATWSVELRTGRADVEVPSAAIPSAVLVVAGKRSGGIALSGSMTVLADATGVVVVNREGEALAGTADRWKPLAPGYQRAFSAADPNAPSAPLPMVGKPSFQAIPPMWFAYGGEANLNGIEWLPVARAASYVLELEHEDGTVQVRRTSATRLEKAFEPLSPGRYRLRIGAYDARGIESGWSERTALHVLGVELPPGAYADDGGAIHLAPGQRVEVGPVAGVEMSYAGKGKFIAAASAFSVIRDEPRAIWLRPHGSAAARALKLVPRQLTADIELGPRKAVWPRDSVTVRVRLKDASGKPLPSWLKATTKVSIGLEPVDLKWRREQGSLYATVPAPAKPGPWVVRVEVFDQYQIPLGYDFLEIADVKPEARPLSTR